MCWEARSEREGSSGPAGQGVAEGDQAEYHHFPGRKPIPSRDQPEDSDEPERVLFRRMVSDRGSAAGCVLGAE